MNPALLTTFWRQRLKSPIRMSFLLLCLAFAAIQAAIMPVNPTSVGGSALMLTWIFCAGMISQDLSNGTAHLILARPVRRAEYVFARVVAVVLAAGLAYLVETVIACLVTNAATRAIDFKGIVPGVVEGLTLILGVTSVVACLSTVAKGLGDLSIYVMLMVIAGLGEPILQLMKVSRAHEIGQWVGRFVFPAVGQVEVLGDGPWIVAIRYTVIVAGWLVLARFAFGRRELSYS